ALLEIFREFLRRRRRNVAGLGRAEQNIFDGTLFVLVTVERLRRGFRGGHVAADRHRHFPAQGHAALLGGKAGLVIAGVANDVFEPLAIELAGWSAKRRIVHDQPGDFRVREAQAHLPRLLVDCRLGDDLVDDLLLDSELLRLRRSDRAAQFAADLLQAIVVGLAELPYADLGVADLRETRAPVAAENITDTPDAEGEDQEPDHAAHDPFADRGGGGFAQTAEHGETGRGWRGFGRKAAHHRD